MRYLLIALIFLPIFSNAQVKGKVTDSTTKEGVFGVKIQSSEGQRAITETDGSFQISIANYPVELYLQSLEHKPDTVEVEKETALINLTLTPLFQEVGTVVVSASKRDEKLEEVSISMEVLKPELIEAKGFVNLEQAVDQSPGVYAMDGQVSIRGGGGYSYGVGSRVLVLTNGIPLISPDLGDAKWNSISMESMSQIEITKGASSVLYGSSALNGTISVTSKEPTKEGEFKARIQSGIFDNPKRETLKW